MDIRISFPVDSDLYKRARTVPWGLRSAVLRVLLDKAIKAAEREGNMIYAAICDGDFELVYKQQQEREEDGPS